MADDVIAVTDLPGIDCICPVDCIFVITLDCVCCILLGDPVFITLDGDDFEASAALIRAVEAIVDADAAAVKIQVNAYIKKLSEF